MFDLSTAFMLDGVYFVVVEIGGRPIEISARTEGSADVPLSDLEREAVAAVRAAVDRGELSEATLIARGEDRRPAGPSLAEVRAAAIARINREAGEARTRHITVVAGQEGTYLEKGREAKAWLADPDPDPAGYPYLAAEAAHTGSTIAEVAALVNATRRAWTQLNAEIEGRRRGALIAVGQAGTAGDVEAVFPVAWSG